MVVLLLLVSFRNRVQPVPDVFTGCEAIPRAGHCAGRCAEPCASPVVVPTAQAWHREGVPRMWSPFAPEEGATGLKLRQPRPLRWRKEQRHRDCRVRVLHLVGRVRGRAFINGLCLHRSFSTQENKTPLARVRPNACVDRDVSYAVKGRSFADAEEHALAVFYPFKLGAS